MKNLFSIVIAVLIGGFAMHLYHKKGDGSQKEQVDIITEKIQEVNKLITLETNFSEVYTLDQNQKLFEIIPIKKSAIVIARAKVYIAYNLEKMEYNINPNTKTVTLSSIPDPEIIVDPALEFYDFKANLIPFTKEELNRLNERATILLREEAQKEHILALAKQNLQNNLEKIYVVANHYKWDLIIEE